MAAMQPSYFSSTKYMWSGKERLGHGATGQVYLGYHKEHGTEVAVKMFTKATEFKAMHNEMQTIQQLPRHENIVRFLEINDHEKQTRCAIIVMELCNAGSLYEVIDAPENAFGLDEVQFKTVIHDVANGLAHLKSHGFAHRDIKPGNIMRCQKTDGSYIFKLADFGTARKLGPQECFTSLHGTEEYLYPAMYERALINPRVRAAFVDKVDLWSIGATFYHVATGKLPFQPFHKRDDRPMMYNIISQKQTGVISGHEVQPGRIEYSKELPKNILLTKGLRSVVEPILAGLLESDFSKMLEFRALFDSIDRIVKMKVIDVFCVSECKCHRFYLKPNEPDPVFQIKHLLSKETKMKPDAIELYFQNLPFQPKTKLTTSQLPNTTPDCPITVFGGNPLRADTLETPPLPDIPKPVREISILEDLRYAKECCKFVCAYKHRAENLERAYRLMMQSALCLGENIQNEFSTLKRQVDKVLDDNVSTSHLIHEQIIHVQVLLGILDAANRLLEGALSVECQQLQIELQEKQKMHQRLEDQTQLIGHQMRDLEPQAVSILDKCNWDSHLCAKVFDRSVEGMEFCFKSVKKLFDDLQMEKKTMKGMLPTQFDRRVHEITKMHLGQRVQEAQDKVAKVLDGRLLVYKKLYDFLGMCAPLREEIITFRLSLAHSSKECQQVLDSLSRWKGQHQQRVQRIQQAFFHKAPVESGSASRHVNHSSPGSSLSENQLQDIHRLLHRMREMNQSLSQHTCDQLNKIAALKIDSGQEDN